MRSEFNLAYGHETRQVADVYYGSAEGPVIIFIHGGSWRAGDKSTYRFMGRSLARQGFTTYVPNYRLYPAVTFPGFMADVAAATAWVAGRHPGAPIVIMGHSAGAHMAVILGLDLAHFKAQRVPIERVYGIVGLSGPYDFNPGKPLQPIFAGTPATAWRPVTIPGKPRIPMLLFHGRADMVVGAENSLSLADSINRRGGIARAAIFRYFDHYTILLPFLPGLSRVSTLRRELTGFLNSATAAKRPAHHSGSGAPGASGGRG